jgi:hypothetical protein
LQTYASNPKATVGDYIFSMTLGAAFGAANPLGAFLGFAGSVIGGEVAESMGFEWRHGVLVGGILGDIAGTGAAAFGRGGSLGYALKAMAPELIGGTGGFIYGYHRTGTFEGAMQYAGYGVALGGIASAAFIKCFVAGTPVYVPLNSLPVTASTTTALAMSGLVECDTPVESHSGFNASEMMAASAAIAIGVAGWAVGQAYLHRQQKAQKDEKRRYEEATDWLFGRLQWE